MSHMVSGPTFLSLCACPRGQVTYLDLSTWSMGHLYLVGDCDFQVAVLGFIIKLISITSSVPSSTHERKFLGSVINGIILS